MIFSKWLSGALTVLMIAGAVSFAPKPTAAAGGTEPEWPVLLDDAEDGQTIYSSLSVFLRNELPLAQGQADIEYGPKLFELSPHHLPAGYTRMFVAIADRLETVYVVLLASDDNADQIMLLDKVSASDTEGELVPNLAKLDVQVKNNRITVWSQLPFRATQSQAVLEWDGKKLNIVAHEYSDPSAEFFERKAALLKKADLAGLMKLEQTAGGLWYPLFYEDYFTLAGPTLQLAYKKAMDAYRKGDAKTAVSYLHYGLQQYSDPYGLFDWEDGALAAADLAGDPEGFDPPGQLSPAIFIAMLNDYGFFLSETKRYREAKPILLNVIQLSPGRVVAYLNAADAEWALAEKKAAKAHYQKYLKLLGKNASKAPKRVKERINSK